MDIESAKFLFQIAQFLATLGLAFYVHLTNKDKVTNDRITALETNVNTKIQKLDDDVEERLKKHGEDIARLEESEEHGPTHHDLGKLHEKVNSVDRQVGAISGQLAGVESNVRQIMNRVLEKGLS